MCFPNSKQHRILVACSWYLSVVTLSLVFQGVQDAFWESVWVAHLDALQPQFTWRASTEVMWEVEGLQHYVAALAAHDMHADEPLHLSAALGVVPSGRASLNMSGATMGSILNVQAFWGGQNSYVHDLTPVMPLNWGMLEQLCSRGFSAGSSGQAGFAPPTLHVTSALRGGGPKRSSGPPPAAGWCANRHKPLKAAQSGYRGTDGRLYCKAFFRKMLPDLHEAKMAHRKSTCQFCSSCKDLVGGFCRPCRTKRACSSCGDMNIDQDAVVCSS